MTELRGAAVFAPHILQFEMANIAWKKIRRQFDKRLAAASAVEI